MDPRQISAIQWSNHYRGEKLKLLTAVDTLCQELGRPVCSADLHAHFRREPDRRPCLLKRLGQQLIAASLPQHRVVPYLHKIGIFHYKAYYALNDSGEWRERFSDYCIERRLHKLLDCKIPDHIALLADGPFKPLAVHAANGWLAEIDALARQHRHPAQARMITASDLDFVASYASGEFRLPSPPLLVDRVAATALLIGEVTRRREDGASLSSRRHLIRFRWPQSALFPENDNYRACPTQLLHFIRGKWSIDDEDEKIHRAIAECLRYGAPGTVSESLAIESHRP